MPLSNAPNTCQMLTYTCQMLQAHAKCSHAIVKFSKHILNALSTCQMLTCPCQMLWTLVKCSEHMSNAPNSSLHLSILGFFCVLFVLWSKFGCAAFYLLRHGFLKENFFSLALIFVFNSNTMCFHLLHMLSHIQFPNCVLLFHLMFQKVPVSK